jgi:hypothetical protein
VESLGLEYGDLENTMVWKVWFWNMEIWRTQWFGKSGFGIWISGEHNGLESLGLEYGDQENGLPWILKAANACRDKGMKVETVRRYFYADCRRQTHEG